MKVDKNGYGRLKKEENSVIGKEEERRKKFMKKPETQIFRIHCVYIEFGRIWMRFGLAHAVSAFFVAFCSVSA